MENIIKDLKTNEEKINKIVFSDSKSEIKKIIVRKIDLKGKTKWQIERFVGAQVFHENVDFVGVLSLNFNDYKQIMLEKEGETSVYSKTKNGFKVKSNKNNVITNVSTHNKEKNYIINAGDDVPALVDLGIFSKDKKIINSMYDKFKQINKFIELIDDEFKDKKMDNITILDFG